MSENSFREYQSKILNQSFLKLISQFINKSIKISQILSVKFDKELAYISESIKENEQVMQNQLNSVKNAKIRPKLRLEQIINLAAQQMKPKFNENNQYALFRYYQKDKLFTIKKIAGYLCLLVALRIIYLNLKKDLLNNQCSTLKATCNIGITVLFTAVFSILFKTTFPQNGFKYGILVGSLLGSIVKNISNRNKWFQQ